MDVGAEMRAAKDAAAGIGAQIVLGAISWPTYVLRCLVRISHPCCQPIPKLPAGDRPIEITLKRAWDSLSLLERLQLGAVLVAGLSAPMPKVPNHTNVASLIDSPQPMSITLAAHHSAG